MLHICISICTTYIYCSRFWENKNQHTHITLYLHTDKSTALIFYCGNFFLLNLYKILEITIVRFLSFPEKFRTLFLSVYKAIHTSNYYMYTNRRFCVTAIHNFFIQNLQDSRYCRKKMWQNLFVCLNALVHDVYTLRMEFIHVTIRFMNFKHFYLTFLLICNAKYWDKFNFFSNEPWICKSHVLRAIIFKYTID